MKRTRGFQLPQLTLNHIDFIVGLEDTGLLTPKESREEIETYLMRAVPKEARPVLFPFTGEVSRLVYDHYRGGRKKIAIYRDTKGQRYVAADYLARTTEP